MKHVQSLGYLSTKQNKCRLPSGGESPTANNYRIKGQQTEGSQVDQSTPGVEEDQEFRQEKHHSEAGPVGTPEK